MKLVWQKKKRFRKLQNFFDFTLVFHHQEYRSLWGVPISVSFSRLHTLVDVTQETQSTPTFENKKSVLESIRIECLAGPRVSTSTNCFLFGYISPNISSPHLIQMCECDNSWVNRIIRSTYFLFFLYFVKILVCTLIIQLDIL